MVDRPEDLLPDKGEPPHADVIAFARWAASTPPVVLSRTMERARWPLTRFVRPVAEAAALRQQPGGTIDVGGGAQAVASLMNADLIDEWRLVLHPLALGAGKPLFGTLEQRRRFALIDTKAQADGCVRLTYRRG